MQSLGKNIVTLRGKHVENKLMLNKINIQKIALDQYGFNEFPATPRKYFYLVIS